MDDVNSLRLGEFVTRSRVAGALGGATRGGIEPSRTTSNIALYSDPEAGERNGYRFDGWSTDESQVFYFTGDGRNGDQRLWKRNRSVLMHESGGRHLQLFVAPRGQRGGPKLHEYVGQFRIDAADPYRREDAPGADGVLRSVVVFRLLAIDAVRSEQSPDAPSPGLDVEVRDVAPETVGTATVRRPEVPETIADRDEAALERDFRAFLLAQGGDPVRKAIHIPGHSRALLTDTFDRATNILYEAKGTSTRESVRMAIGQLLDYRRFITPRPTCAVLLQVCPARDLVELVLTSGLMLVYREGSGFATVEG